MHKTTNEIRISDWSSDVCSSDLFAHAASHLIELIGRRSSAGDQLPERIRAPWGQIERDGLGRRSRLRNAARMRGDRRLGAEHAVDADVPRRIRQQLVQAREMLVDTLTAERQSVD